MSLYEALVAVALIGVGAAMVSQLDQIIPDRRVSLKRVCDSHAQAIAVAVQEETYYREVLNFNPVGTSIAARTIPQAFTNPTSRALTNPADAWTPATGNRFVVTEPTGSNYNNGVTLRNAELIQGSIRTLSSIYNNNPGVRCTPGAYPPLTNIVPPVELRQTWRNAVTTIQIRPYNMDGSAVTPACPAPPMSIGPAGEFELNGTFNAFALGSGYNPTAGSYYEDWVNPAAFGYAGVWPEPDNTGFDDQARLANPGTAIKNFRGFHLDVNVTYRVDENNAAITDQCSFTQKFEYPRDRKAPPPPNHNLVTPGSNLTAEPANTCSLNTPTTVSIEIGYVQGGAGNPQFERGTQFLCRDLSWIKGFPPSFGAPPVYTETMCIFNGTVRPANKVYPPYYPYYDPQYADFSRRGFPNPGNPNPWVPCDELRQCGLAPASVSYSQAGANTAGDNHFYTLVYPIMPFGCVLNYEVIAVDTAGNTSLAGNDSLTGPVNRRFLDDGAFGTALDHEIHYGGCGGYYVPGTAYYGGNTFLKGFYTNEFTCP